MSTTRSARALQSIIGSGPAGSTTEIIFLAIIGFLVIGAAVVVVLLYVQERENERNDR